MKKLWCILTFIVTLAGCNKSISEFQSQNFIKYFGEGLGAQGFDVLEIAGGYVVAGFNSTALHKKQVFVVKTDKAGNTIWARQFGTAHSEEGYIVRTVNNEFYTLGLQTNDFTGIKNSFVLKISSQGDSLTTFTIGDPNYSLVINDMVVGESAFYLAGESYQNSPTQPDYYLAKFTLDGNPIWQRTLAGSGSQSFKRIFVNQTGGIIALGTTNAVIGSPYTHISVVEFSEQGLPINSKELDTQANQQFGDAIRNDNQIIVAFNVETGSSTTPRLVSLSNQSFETLWQSNSTLGAPITSMANSSQGTISLFGGKDNVIFLSQINSTGTVVLESSMVKQLAGSVKAVISTSDKGWGLVGTTTPDYGTMMQLIKTDEKLFLFER